MVSRRAPLSRLEGLDLARAFAIAGMVVVNYALVITPSSQTPAWLNLLLTAISGRAAALFVVLAGLGVALLARSKPEAQAIVQRRAGFLLLIGLAFSAVWPPDILQFYAVYLVVAALLLSAGTKTLFLVGASILSITPILHLPLDYTTGWDFDALTYEDMWRPDALVRRLFFNGFHPFFPWFVLVIIGMLLARLDLEDRRTRAIIIVAGAVTAGVLEALSYSMHSAEGLYEITLLRGPMPPTPLFILSAGATACTAVALSIEAAALLPRAVVRPLVCTGQLALTLYLAHVLVGLWIYEDIIITVGLPGLYEPFAYASIFMLTSILFASLWRRCFRRGPVESLLRGVSSLGLRSGRCP